MFSTGKCNTTHVGLIDGCTLIEGCKLGDGVGSVLIVGETEGLIVGVLDSDGEKLGSKLGNVVGLVEGSSEGLEDAYFTVYVDGER